MAKAERQIKIDEQTLTVREQNSHAKFDITKGIKQRAKGMTYQEIANDQGISKTQAYEGLAPYKEHLDKLQAYQGNKSTLQDMAANKCLTELLNKDMESEKASSIAAAFKVFNDANRLETGQSTQNVSIKLVDLTQFAGDATEDGS